MLLGLLSDCFHIAFSLLGPYKKWRAPGCRLTPGGSQTKKHGWDLIGIGMLRALRLLSGWFQIAFRLLVPYNTGRTPSCELPSDSFQTPTHGWHLIGHGKVGTSRLLPYWFQTAFRWGCEGAGGRKVTGMRGPRKELFSPTPKFNNSGIV